jgi:hypothetical protein
MRGKYLIVPVMSKNLLTVWSKGNEFIRQLFVVFFLLTSFQTIQRQGTSWTCTHLPVLLFC